MFVAQVAHTQSAQATHAPARDPYALRKIVLARVAEALPIFEAEAPDVLVAREMLTALHARMTDRLSPEAFSDAANDAFDAMEEASARPGLTPAACAAVLAVDAMMSSVDEMRFAEDAFGYAEEALALSQAAKAA